MLYLHIIRFNLEILLDETLPAEFAAKQAQQQNPLSLRPTVPLLCGKEQKIFYKSVAG